MCTCGYHCGGRCLDLACKQAIQRPGAGDMEIMPNERKLSFQARTLNEIVSSWGGCCVDRVWSKSLFVQTSGTAELC